MKGNGRAKRGQYDAVSRETRGVPLPCGTARAGISTGRRESADLSRLDAAGGSGRRPPPDGYFSGSPDATRSVLRSGCRDNHDCVATRPALFALGAFCARHSGRAGCTRRAGRALFRGRARCALRSGRSGNGYRHDGRRGRRHNHRRPFTRAQCQRGQRRCNYNRISHDDSSYVSNKNRARYCAQPSKRQRFPVPGGSVTNHAVVVSWRLCKIPMILRNLLMATARARNDWRDDPTRSPRCGPCASAHMRRSM